MGKKKREKEFTIFGMDPILAILLLPVVLFFAVLDSDK